MDVVGGVIVAAQSGKGGGGGGGGGGSRDEDGWEGGGGGSGGGGGGGVPRGLMISGMKRTGSGGLCFPGDHQQQHNHHHHHYGPGSVGTFAAGSCSVASWGEHQGGNVVGGGGVGSVHHLWNRRVSPRRGLTDTSAGSAASAAAALHHQHERDNRERDDYELRSVISCSKTTPTVSLSPPVSGGARLGRSTSWGDHHHSHSSFGTQDNTTRALLAPFYRPANPVFVKPQPARSWVDPLRFLLKKELTVTDVGELGRIILPKRDAECQLPQLDSKEGKLLSMEDYNSNKHWTLRYKWWPNNKSRMYVLESTGEFVKYYDLKEKDELIVYKDGVGNLVIRGQKWSPANSLLRTDSFFPPSALKGKSTGKRSPKGAHTRANARLSPTAPSSSSNATGIQAPSPSPKAQLDSSSSASEAHDSAADGLEFKLGPTSTTTALQMGMGKMNMHPLDCGLLQSSQLLSTSVLTTSVLSTSVLSTSILSTVDQSEIASMVNSGPMGSYSGAVGGAGGHTDGAIDWEKLPDPPSIEFGDPPVIEFPGEFECTWGDCI